MAEAKETCPTCSKNKYDPTKYKQCYRCTEKARKDEGRRDYFAAHALQGLLTEERDSLRSVGNWGESEKRRNEIVDLAWEIAGRMLKRRPEDPR